VFFLFLWASVWVTSFRLVCVVSSSLSVAMMTGWNIAILYRAEYPTSSFFYRRILQRSSGNVGVFIGVRGFSAPRCFHFGPS
jgi:hypothetical protein